MKIKKILVVFKFSAYDIYFLQRKNVFLKRRKFSDILQRFRNTHSAHYGTLRTVERVLDKKGIKYHKSARGRKINYEHYDLIITVGGDGTFLEAARNVKHQIILGVNSDPQWSVGKFCSADAKTFEVILQRVLQGKAPVRRLPRLQLRVNPLRKPIAVLNELLFCHHSPAAMSRYQLVINSTGEEQRSSGVWISTAAGSTGAIKSAGGRFLPPESKKIQYKPRELHRRSNHKNKLTGGVVMLKRPLQVISLMREGVIFVDGDHLEVPFAFGTTARVSCSPCPLKVAGFKRGRRI